MKSGKIGKIRNINTKIRKKWLVTRERMRKPKNHKRHEDYRKEFVKEENIEQGRKENK